MVTMVSFHVKKENYVTNPYILPCYCPALV